MRARLLLFTGLLLLTYSCNKLRNHTWSGDIAAIVHSKCSPCHHNYNSGHFRLISYEDVKSKAGMIKYVVEKNMMPPWPADPHYTQFSNQMTLSKKEKESLILWVEANCPKGNGEVDDPKFENSFYGVPDMTIPVKPIFLKGDGVDNFLIVKVPFELPESRVAKCIEFVPGNKNLVHHANGDVVIYDEDKECDLYGGDYVVPTVGDMGDLFVFEQMHLPYKDGSYPRLMKSVVNYLPGVFPAVYPDEIGGVKLAKKNAFLLNDLHYGGVDQDEWDSSYINIYFRKAPTGRVVKEFQLGTLGISPIVPPLIIPPNKVSTFTTSYTLPQDISILTVNPHMHLLGKSFWAFAYKEEDTIPLIKIPKWDFNWQYFYTYTHPVKVPEGYTLHVEGVFDNTSDNLFNPNTPPQWVTDSLASMRTSDEMFQFIINFVDYKSGDEQISLELKK